MTWQPVDKTTPRDRPIMVKGGYVLVMNGDMDGAPLESPAVVQWQRAYRYAHYGLWMIPQTPVQIINPQSWREIPDDHP